MTAPKHPVIEAPATVVTPTDSPLDTKDNKASKTTAEEDLKTAGQRWINNVWECTQAIIALAIVLTTCFGVLRKYPSVESPFSAQWWTILGLVIGFYFGRTNHARVGDAAQDAAASR